MQDQNAHKDLSTDDAANASADQPHSKKKQPYVTPTIPMGLPHVVQYVTGSLLHMPGPLQLMADRMSRYANTDGEVSIALEFLCKISDLGSKNTAKGYIDKLVAMDILEEPKHGQGGNQRKSNTYLFNGAKRNWKPLPGEEPGTDPWLTLLEVRLENEGLQRQVRELTDRLELLTKSDAIGQPGVTNGDGDTGTASYGTATPRGGDGAIGHLGVTYGSDTKAPDTPSHSNETEDSGDSTGGSGAIGHPGVTNGEDTPDADPPSHGYETNDSDCSTGDAGTVPQSEMTDGPTEGEEYLARRARVVTLLKEHWNYFGKQFRKGLNSAVYFFSQSQEKENELIAQVSTLEAEREMQDSGAGPPTESREEVARDSGVAPCPDCDMPFTTYGGAEFCPECTQRRNQAGGDS